MKVKLQRHSYNNWEYYKELNLEVIPRKGDMINFVENQYMRCYKVTDVFLMLTEEEPYYRISTEVK